MFDGILEIVKKTGVFLILAQTILHLYVSDSYEKYLKMLVGLMTAMMLIFPVIEWIREGGFQDFEAYRSEYEEKFWMDAPDFEDIKEENWENYFEEQIGVAP